MHSPTIIILSLVFGLMNCSDSTLRADSSPEKPAEVVRLYVSFARSGEFEKLQSVMVSPLPEKTKSATAPVNTGNETGNASSTTEGSNDGRVFPVEGVDANARLEWVVGDFAKSIHDEKLAIKLVKGEAANDTDARVEVILGNENTTNPLGWIFLLRKVKDGWKIYDITTAGANLAPLR